MSARLVKSKVLLVVVSTMVFLSLVSPAHALDKRLSLGLKTAGYGAAGGFLLGAGTYALGIGDWKNMLIGTSAGMYMGIALAGYLILTQDDYLAEKQQRSKNRYAPRRPVTPDDWEDEDNEDEDLREHLPEQTDPDARLKKGDKLRPTELVVWAPVFSMRF